jgi:F-type H+-transporting ATPase subunit alpha
MPHDIAWQHEAAARVQATTLAPAPEYRGRVEEVADGVAMISGLPHLRLGELLRFDSGAFGFAQVLEPDRIGCVLLDAARALQARHRALSTGIW